MKRRRVRYLWLLPIFLSVLIFVFIKIMTSPGPGTKTKQMAAPATAPRPSTSETRKTPASIKPVDNGKASKPPVVASAPPMAAIIIDDIGYNLEAVENARAVGCPLTLSILPFATLTEESVRLADACGLETMLHLPLESGSEKRGAAIEGTIFEDMPEGEIRATVEKCLARVPNAAGANNHTGSAATEDARVMRPILETLKKHDLYFIDSRTTSASIAYDEAEKIGVRASVRRVFIDAEPGEKNIAAKLRELFTLAKKDGRAVGICHPKRETLAALALHIGLADTFGVKLVFASAIVD